MAKQRDDAADRAAAQRQALLTGEHAAAGAMRPAQADRPAAGGGRRPMVPAPAPQVDQAMVAAAVSAAMTAVAAQQAQRTGTPNMDKTIPGGCYIVEGVCVNAHNEVIEHPDAAAAALDEWYDREADARQGQLVMQEADEEPADEELSTEEKQVAASNEARSQAADELRKRAEAAAKEAGKATGLEANKPAPVLTEVKPAPPASKDKGKD